MLKLLIESLSHKVVLAWFSACTFLAWILQSSLVYRRWGRSSFLLLVGCEFLLALVCLCNELLFVVVGQIYVFPLQCFQVIMQTKNSVFEPSNNVRARLLVTLVCRSLPLTNISKTLCFTLIYICCRLKLSNGRYEIVVVLALLIIIEWLSGIEMTSGHAAYASYRLWAADLWGAMQKLGLLKCLISGRGIIGTEHCRSVSLQVD